MYRIVGVLLFISFLSILQACSPDDKNESNGNGVTFYIPDGFPAPVYNFQNNPITPSGFALGRKLFYDPILSRDSSISCGSCHQQFVAFAHADHTLSHGIDGLLGTRNSPALFNIAWYPSFMWDGGVNHLEVQPLAPIANPVEMDESIANVIVKLQRSLTYQAMYQSAFGTDSVTTQLTMRALAQFMGSMISANSKYDKYREGKGALTSPELNGLQLFRTHCESCHSEPLLTDMQFRNNGLDNTFDSDPGRAKITNLPQDSGLFKVPSLRNIALTYPYMHDGRFQNLGQVLDHYMTGIKQSATLDPLLSTGGIPLNPQDKSDIISFLETLTDQKFITDRRFKEVQ
ncbi:MAG: c-type cytochrome [Bacteroidetes bacterium]|nr:c-type cytochrome [Bacteroidota bacterium]